MKIRQLLEYNNPRLDTVVNIIKTLETHFSKETKKELKMKLNPDQTSCEDNQGIKSMLMAATISMVGSHYGTNNAVEIEHLINELVDTQL